MSRGGSLATPSIIGLMSNEGGGIGGSGRPFMPPVKTNQCYKVTLEDNYPFTDGASTEARSRGKLCAFLSCITSIPRLAG